MQGSQRETRAESDVANMSQHDGCEGSSISILVVMVVDGCEAFLLACARACPWRAELCKRVHNLLGFGSINQENFLSVKQQKTAAGFSARSHHSAPFLVSCFVASFDKLNREDRCSGAIMT